MRHRVSTRTLVLVGLALSLLLVGVASSYASSHPDGLEYVAEQVGFGQAARDSAAAGSPLSDYQVRGVEDGRLSGGLAGIVGVLVVGVLAFGLTRLLRGRGPAGDRATREQR